MNVSCVYLFVSNEMKNDPFRSHNGYIKMFTTFGLLLFFVVFFLILLRQLYFGSIVSELMRWKKGKFIYYDHATFHTKLICFVQFCGNICVLLLCCTFQLADCHLQTLIKAWETLNEREKFKF